VERAVTIEMFLQLATQAKMSHCWKLLWWEAVVYFIWSISIWNSSSPFLYCQTDNTTVEFRLIWFGKNNCTVMK